MKHIAKNQATYFENSDACSGYDYDFADKDINGSPITVKGRYPDKGRVLNTVCKELAYIVEGSGILVCEGVETSFQQYDSLLVEPGEKYYWEGNFTAYMSCAPAWYEEQHVEVE